jgi:RNA polymerase sigma-70 factor (ECF subfamily)
MTSQNGAQDLPRQSVMPQTDWGLVSGIQEAPSDERRERLGFLVERYWRPVYAYVRSRGHNDEQAKDLVQDFFEAALRRNLFGKATPDRGRLRSFLLASLEHFLLNSKRAATAQRRQPKGGFLAANDWADSYQELVLAVDCQTPASLFHKAWISDLLLRVLRILEQECKVTGKEVHYAIFQKRIVEPALEGTQPPALETLAGLFDLTEREVANRLITARRAYQRLLREEIRQYAASEEEVAQEVQDLFHFMGGE